MAGAGFRAPWLQQLLANGYFTEGFVQNYEMMHNNRTAHEFIALSITDLEATDQLLIRMTTDLPGTKGSAMPQFRIMLRRAQNGKVPRQWVVDGMKAYEQLIHCPVQFWPALL